jgi:hypothetical protein
VPIPTKRGYPYMTDDCFNVSRDLGSRELARLPLPGNVRLDFQPLIAGSPCAAEGDIELRGVCSIFLIYLLRTSARCGGVVKNDARSTRLPRYSPGLTSDQQ